MSSETLSAREFEILQLVSQGLNYKDIAAQTFISPQTVRTHIKNIYKKLQVHNKLEAVVHLQIPHLRY